MNRIGGEPHGPFDVLTAPEAAAVKGVHRNSVLKAIRKGYLQARKSGRSWIIDRGSLDRWEPRGRGDRASRAVQTAAPPVQGMPDETEADRKVRIEKLMRLLDQWVADESSDDEEAWPKLKAVLEQDRLSSRPLFREVPR
jgi:excisionase family DNA binding protein